MIHINFFNLHCLEKNLSNPFYFLHNYEKSNNSNGNNYYYH